MITKAALTALTGLVFGLVLIMPGCSDNGPKGAKSESITETIIDEVVENTYADVQAGVTDVSHAVDTNLGPAEVVIDATANEPSGVPIYDMIIKDKVIYAIVDDGLLLHDLAEGKNLIIPFDEPIGAIVDLGEKILVGASNLYTLDRDILSDEDYRLDLSGTITALHRRGVKMYLGTTDGLYELSIGGIRELARDIRVSALVSDQCGAVWVGTAGDGLYCWDGERFQKRFLRRDSTLFDKVTALDFNHDHLYLGTDRGFFIFDGGSWQAYDLADGLPSEMITSINANDWVIKIGTDRGPVTFFNNEFRLMSRLAGISVTRLISYDGRTIAATSNRGLLMSSGGLITSLYDGKPKASPLALEEAL